MLYCCTGKCTEFDALVYREINNNLLMGTLGTGFASLTSLTKM